MTDSIVPSMPPVVLEFLQHKINHASEFLEYGSGGSTCLASKSDNIQQSVSVESDKNWAEKVALAVSPGKCHIEYIDIGPVIAWGTPSSDQGIRDYWRYVYAPWRYARENGINPDLVLIDGRFRVASFLLSLVSARPGTLICFDDYMIRPEYHLVERFVSRSDVAGYMAAFVVPDDIPRSLLPEISVDIARYSLESR